MKIDLRLTTLLWIFFVMLLAGGIACGQVHKSQQPDAAGGSDTCVWDQSTWDNCALQ